MAIETHGLDARAQGMSERRQMRNTPRALASETVGELAQQLIAVHDLDHIPVAAGCNVQPPWFMEDRKSVVLFYRRFWHGYYGRCAGSKTTVGFLLVGKNFKLVPCAFMFPLQS